MASVALCAESPSAPYQVISAEDDRPKEPRPLHRIRDVRAEQGVSLRTISRRTGIEIRQLREHEDPYSDLSLSDLRLWQEALEVPMVDLLVDNPLGLSAPIAQRGKLVKIMKTVMALMETATTTRTKRMVAMLQEQMIDLMPELAQVSAWPNYGSRRSPDSAGKIAESPIPITHILLENAE